MGSVKTYICMFKGSGTNRYKTNLSRDTLLGNLTGISSQAALQALPSGRYLT